MSSLENSLINHNILPLIINNINRSVSCGYDRLKIYNITESGNVGKTFAKFSSTVAIVVPVGNRLPLC